MRESTTCEGESGSKGGSENEGSSEGGSENGCDRVDDKSSSHRKYCVDEEPGKFSIVTVFDTGYLDRINCTKCLQVLAKKNVVMFLRHDRLLRTACRPVGATFEAYVGAKELAEKIPWDGLCVKGSYQNTSCIMDCLNKFEFCSLPADILQIEAVQTEVAGQAVTAIRVSYDSESG